MNQNRDLIAETNHDSEIERLGRTLKLSTTIQEFALHVHTQAVTAGYQPQAVDRLPIACLYLATQRYDESVSIDEFASVSQQQADDIRRESALLSAALGLRTGAIDPALRIEAFGNDLGWDQASIDGTLALYERVRELKLYPDRAPDSIAASVLYAQSKIKDLGETQQSIATVADVSEVTIRKLYPTVLQEATDVNPRELVRREFDIAFELLEDHLDQYDIPQSVYDRARNRALDFDEVNLGRGQSRAAIACAAYYAEIHYYGHRWIAQAELATVTGTTGGTVSNYVGRV